MINGEKPRKGSFVVADGAGNTYVELLGMARPFAKLKALDMDKLAEEIIGGLSG